MAETICKQEIERAREKLALRLAELTEPSSASRQSKSEARNVNNADIAKATKPRTTKSRALPLEPDDTTLVITARGSRYHNIDYVGRLDEMLARYRS